MITHTIRKSRYKEGAVFSAQKPHMQHGEEPVTHTQKEGGSEQRVVGDVS